MLKPMLCEESEPFSSQNYSFEVKWDGERALLYFEGSKVRIQNRRGDDITFRYPELQIPNGKRAVIDGEIVVLDSMGRSNFNLVAQRSHLQKTFDIALRMKTIPVTFKAFDILSFEGENLTKLPLSDRRIILYREFTPIPTIFEWSLSLDREGNGIALFGQAEKLGLEGIIGKRLDSPYLYGKRSYYWRKCKCVKSIDMMFTRYTINNAGIRVENDNGIAVQIAGYQSTPVRQQIDRDGKAVVEVKIRRSDPDSYITKNGKLRMPTFKRLVV